MEQSENLYNKDELHPPNWLDEKFLLNVLRHHESCEDVEIDKFEISPGSGKGDHYASVMFRAKVNYSFTLNSKNVKKFKSLILKTIPEEEGMKRDLLQSSPLFATEIRMYSEILPKMERVLKAVGDETQLCAKLVYSSTKPRECLVFEDLVELGYAAIKDRKCTLKEVNTAFGILARIHAVSLKLLESGYKEFLEYKSAFNQKTMEKFEFLRDGVKNIKEVLNEIDDLRIYMPYIEKVEKSINAEVSSFFDLEEIRKRGGILVLNHGDYHMKNMMVKYTEGSFKNLMLVDYQISYYGQSALDLLYGYVMMLSPEMRRDHRNEIYSNYFETFQTVLRKLNYSGKIPTKSEFEAELKKYKRWELFLVLSFLMFNHAFTDSSIELGEVAEDPVARKKFWLREDVKNELRWQLPRLVKEGYFD